VDAINPAQALFAAFFAIYFALNIDRAQREYSPYDTYAVWKGSRHAIRRLVASLVVVFILPMVQFAITFGLLDRVELTFNVSVMETLAIVGIGFFVLLLIRLLSHLRGDHQPQTGGFLPGRGPAEVSAGGKARV
jgi:hypothetical protein